MLSSTFFRGRGHCALKVAAVLRRCTNGQAGLQGRLFCRVSRAALSPRTAVMVSLVCAPVLTSFTGATAM